MAKTGKLFNFYRVSIKDDCADGGQQTLLNRLSDKHEILEALFKTKDPIEFTYNGSNPVAFIEKQRVGDFIIAQLGKKTSRNFSGPPETNFRMANQEDWPNVLVIINTSTIMPFGQTIAVQLNKYTFKNPLFPLRQLSKSLATLQPEKLFGYDFKIDTVTQNATFWEIIKQHQGDIAELELRLTTPNFLNSKTKLSEGLKELEQTYNANSVKTSISNSSGDLIIPENDRLINEALEQASEGAGEILLRPKSGTVIKSSNYTVNCRISSDDLDILVSGKDSDSVKNICKEVFSCLKK